MLMFGGFVDIVCLNSEVTYIHDGALCVLMVAIVPAVGWLVSEVMTGSMLKVNVLLSDESLAKKVEVVWTAVPILLLCALSVVSVSSLYVTDNMVGELVIKVIGNQWYWTWEYWDPVKGLSIDGSSYVLSKEDLTLDGYFALDVDNRICIPTMNSVEFLVSSSDVLHSFALPNLGVKVDAVPGRIASVFVNVDMPSILYGQCSEMCGTGHSIIPIVVEAIPSNM